MQNGSSGEASTDHKAARAACVRLRRRPTESRDPPELPAIVAEMNNVVAAIAGYAHLPAGEHETKVVNDVSRSAARYKVLAQRLQKCLDRPGQHWSPSPGDQFTRAH